MVTTLRAGAAQGELGGPEGERWEHLALVDRAGQALDRDIVTAFVGGESEQTQQQHERESPALHRTEFDRRGQLARHPPSVPQMNWSRTKVAFSGLESGVAGVCAASDEDRPRWFLATRDGRLRGVDLDDGKTFFDVKAADSFQDATLAASADGWAWRSSGLTARVGCSTT